MNKKKLKKYFKILFVPISMLICLSLFLINTFAQEGYEINNNGNIESLNLFNINNVADGSSANIDPSTGVASGYDSKSTFNFQVQYITQDYNFYTIYSTDFYSPQIVSYTFTKTSDMYWLQFGHNGSAVDVKIRYDIHNFDNGSYTISFNILSISNPQSFDNIMLNSGNVALDYFPYGTYYTTPQDSNFMEYLIGQNYFSSGRAMVYQTNTESPYWDREIYPTNRSCYYQIGSTSIGDYIIGKTLYLQNLSYDLTEGLKLESNYVFERNTTLSLKPSFNFTNSSITYLNIPCKFLNLDIYCPNGVFECSCYVGNGLDIGTQDNERVYFQQSGDYIHIDFDDNDNRWLFEIEIVLNHSNNFFVAPSNIVSNTDDTLQWDLYQIGFDDGFRGQEGKISFLQYQVDDLNSKLTNKQNTINVLQEQNDQLRNSLQQNFGFDDVFFALADTPFKTVSNMLGFELFGVNLFNALVGFITVLACIWLLKKFL